jgi:transposase
MKITTIGLDIAKNVFQIHGVNEKGKVVLRKTLKRDKMTDFFAQLEPCLIGIEACGSAHYWARTLARFGHTVRLMAGQFVAPYRKSGKNDGNDAEDICEAVGRPNMRFVPVKSEEQQAVLMVHRARTLVIESRTAQVNQIRGLLAEFGLVVAQGIDKLRGQLPGLLEDAENGLPTLARETLAELLEQWRYLDQRVAHYDRQIAQWAAASEPAQRLLAVEGDRTAHGHRSGCECGRRQSLPEWPAVCRLAGHGAETALERRQVSLGGGHHQARRRVLAATVDSRCPQRARQPRAM